MIYLTRRTLTLLLTCFMLAAPLCAFAGKPSDKPPPSEDVEKALKRLDSSLRRLHGYQVFHVERTPSGTTTGNVLIEAEFRLIFCSEEAIADLNCFGTENGALVLESGLLSAPAPWYEFSFDENNSADFDAIVAQLTNGNGRDGFRIERNTYADGIFSSGGESSESEFVWANDYTPIAPSAGEIDFQDLEIGSISLRIRYFSAFYDSNSDLTSWGMTYEVFFEMPQ